MERPPVLGRASDSRVMLNCYPSLDAQSLLVAGTIPASFTSSRLGTMLRDNPASTGGPSSVTGSR
jgi:hypothetical protein